MKKTLIAIATALVIAGNVEAKTQCAVSTTSKDANSYDRMLTTVDLNENRYVVIARDLSSAREVKLEELNTPEKWVALDGHLIAGFTKTGDNQYSLIIGKVDKNAENMYSLEALSLGALQDKGFLALMVPKHKLSLSCYQAPN